MPDVHDVKLRISPFISPKSEIDPNIPESVASSSARFQKLLQELQEEYDSILASLCSREDNADAPAIGGEVPPEATEDNETQREITSISELVISEQTAEKSVTPSLLDVTDVHDEWKFGFDNAHHVQSHFSRLCALSVRRCEHGSDETGWKSMSSLSSQFSCIAPNESWSRRWFPSVLPTTLVWSPFSSSRVAWDLLGVMMLAWDLFQVPVGVFDPPVTSIAWSSFDMAGMVFWTMDILASCCVGYYDATGTLIMDFIPVVKNYTRTWFVFDLLMVSLDWFQIIFGASIRASSGARVFKGFRFVRVFRLLRLVKVTSKVKEAVYAWQDRWATPYLNPVLAMLGNLLILLCWTHVVACAWYGIGRLPSGVSWVTEYFMGERILSIHEQPFGMKYLETFRMALVLVCGRHIWTVPTNVGEAFFMIVMNLLGLMIFASFIGGVTSRLTKIRDLMERETLQLFQLKTYLKENHASPLLRERVVHYVEYAIKQHRRCFKSDDVVLLKLISGPLQVELETEVNKPYLVVCPFFNVFNFSCEPAMSQVCFGCLSNETLARDDYLFHSNKMSNRMFIVRNGVLGYLKLHDDVNGERSRVILARRGHWFCEQSLWLPWIHRSKMKALIETDLIGVKSEAFRRTALSHVDVVQICHARALEILQLMKADASARWDVPQELINPDEHVQDDFHKRIVKLYQRGGVEDKSYKMMVERAEEMSSMLLKDEDPEDSRVLGPLVSVFSSKSQKGHNHASL